MKKICLILITILMLCSCSISKIERIHIISECKCYQVETNLIYAKYYVYVNGKRYRRNDVIELRENDKCPYCEKKKNCYN